MARGVAVEARASWKVRKGEVLRVSASNPAAGTEVEEYRMKIPGVREVLLVSPSSHPYARAVCFLALPDRRPK